MRLSDLQNASNNLNHGKDKIMLDAITTHPHRLNSATPPHLRSFVPVLFAIWLALAFSLGALGFFATPQGAPPIPLLLAVLIPVALFVSGFWTWPSFRQLVLEADLRLLTGIQAWRWAGFGFLGFYAAGLLPGYFAWPAALGDMSIGLTAPWIALALANRPGFAASRAFIAWNIFGILDFVVAVGMGAVAPRLFPDLTQGVTTTLMVHLPQVLIPTFAVPMFTIFHLIALFQARHGESVLSRTRRLGSTEVAR
jgi:hypothetical protein